MHHAQDASRQAVARRSRAIARISGQLFLIWGKSVQVTHRPEVDARFESEDRWTADALHAELGPFYDKREPVTDGFLVPPA